MKIIEKHLKLQSLVAFLKQNIQKRKLQKTIFKERLFFKLKKLGCLIFLLCGSAFCGLVFCSKKVEIIDYLLSDDKLKVIQVYQISETNLLTLLGKPTAKSICSSKIYYYMKQEYRQIGLLVSKLVRQKIVAITLNKFNFVSKITIYDKKNSHLLKYDSSQVIVQGDKISVLGIFIKSIGKFNAKIEIAKN